MSVREYTAVYIAGDDGNIVGFIEEIPGAFGQGATLDEARASLTEAAELILKRRPARAGSGAGPVNH